jgi:uncharacterized sulfatase
MIGNIFILFLLILYSLSLNAETLDYQLKAQRVAKDTYVFVGKKENFNRINGGNIVNTAFIVTEQGVIIIDTGPSFLYGQQMKLAISSITDKPVIKIFITHHHPDHFSGNQAFKEVPTYALEKTIELIKRDADGFLNNVYRLVGPWMAGTEISASEIKPLMRMRELIGQHSLKFITLSGHTSADLMLFDETTGVLFTGDLVFHNRAPTTPHADPEKWLSSLDLISAINFEVMVPGHGEVAVDKNPIKQTHDYLVWLETTIRNAVYSGLDMNEILALSIPEKFRQLAVIGSEFSRSISHRYPIYEEIIFNSSQSR